MALIILLAAPALVGPATHAADPQPYTVSIEKTGNAALDKALSDSSTLVSLRESAPVGPFALIARAQQDVGRFETALHSFGYYKGKVDLKIAGRPLNDPNLPDLLDQAPANPPVAVSVKAEPGPLFHLRKVVVEGAIPDAAREKLDLKPGAPAIASDVLAARERLLNAMRDQGYALAEVSEPVAMLDPGADALDVTFQAKSGPRVDLGAIKVEGLKQVNASFIRRRLLVYPGEQYSPEALEKARQDLQATGVFSSVRLVQSDQLDSSGRLPVTFLVTERPRHAVTFGAAYSTDLGAYITATWSHRNLFGNAEQLNLTAGFQGGGTAQVSPGYNVSAQFIKPDFLHRDQSLQVDIGALKQNLEAYDQKSVYADVLLNRKFTERWSGSIGLAGELARITQEFVTRDYKLLSVPITAKYDSTNNLLDPTHGIREAVSLTPTQSFG